MSHKRFWLWIASVLAGVLLPAASPARARLRGDGPYVSGLSTEHLLNPIGVDVPHPRFSWKLVCKQRDFHQTAYEVQVAERPEDFIQGRRMVWDSGIVHSERTVDVPYAGPPLASSSRYYWRVKTWTTGLMRLEGSDKPEWSRIAGTVDRDWWDCAWFETGLLHPQDWRGKWIGWGEQPRSAPPVSLQGAQWLWYPEEHGRTEAEPGTRYFRRVFSLPEGSTLREAVIAVAADDRFTLSVNGEEAGSGEDWRRASFLDVTRFFHPGANCLAIRATNGAKSPAGLIARLRVTTSAGEILIPTDAGWKVARRPVPGWMVAGTDERDFREAESIGRYGVAPWGAITLGPLRAAAPPAAPLLRKEFTTRGRPTRARLSICGLGLYDLRLNGLTVTDTVLNPAQTRYDRRVLYDTYDVTDLVAAGPNCLAVELGRGFYSVREQTPWQWTEAPWISPPKLICELDLRYRDGTTEHVVSDGSWQLCTDGPTRNDSIYWGENYDARKERPRWDRAGYTGSGFGPAAVVPSPAGQLRASMLPRMRVVERRRPTAVTSPRPGSFVFDAGIVTAGWARLSASCPTGTRVRIHYGERLNPDGTVNEWSLNDTDGPPQTDYYTFRGGSTESWSPKFGYKGFRYVEIDDCPVRLAVPNVEICTVHSAVRTIGDFSCTNPLFNTLHQNEVRTVLNNLHGKPTDTPAYEKNGWMGDANVAAETALYNLDLTAFFEKWLDDIHDSMGEEGLVPVIAPTGGWGMSHSPEWNSAYVFIPWHLFQYAGDRGVLRQQYSGFRKYAAYERAQLKNGISNSVLSDWLAPDPDGRSSGAQAPEGGALTSTAYAYRASQLLGEIARLEGKAADAQAAGDTCSQIRAALNARFLDQENRTYHTDIPAGYRQTSNLLPLVWDLVPSEDRKRVLDRLVEEIHRKGDHLDTGCLGTKYLLPLLTEEGHGDVAYAIANQKSYPSWGWWATHGATTMWEAWELSARSYDHYFLGTVDEWFYKYLAGIRSDGDGFREITIRPYLLGDLTSAQAHVDTVRGRVSSSWVKRPDGRVDLEMVIPSTAQATVFVPAPSGTVVTESGVPAERAPGVRLLGRKGDALLYRVGSGAYRFRSIPGPRRRPGPGAGNSTLR